MRKLLSANSSRLWLNKAFWVTVILMVCIESICCLFLFKQGTMPMELIWFISFQVIGVLTSVFFSSFLGTEYSDGTIRNKLIVGHKRSSIYLASLITGIIGITIIFFAGILTGSIIGVLSHASLNNGIGQIALAGFIGWLACISYISIFNLVGMLSSNKTRTSITCVLTSFILVFAGLLCYSLSRPGFLSGFKRVILQFLFEFNPYGQTFQILSIDTAMLCKLAIYALLLSSVLTALGCMFFSKKDLK